MISVQKTEYRPAKLWSVKSAHSEDICHRTAHVWVIRKTENGWQILMQKRAEDKESFPGCYDTSSAGHIPAGCKPLESAIRELKEELGIDAVKEDFLFAGLFRNHYEQIFYGKPFKDNEVSFVYVYDREVDADSLTIQKEELSCVEWFDLLYVYGEKLKHNEKFCVPIEGLRTLMNYLNIDQNGRKGIPVPLPRLEEQQELAGVLLTGKCTERGYQ